MTECCTGFLILNYTLLLYGIFVGLRDKFGIYKIRLKIDGKCRIW